MLKRILKIALCAFAITFTCVFAGLTAFGATISKTEVNYMVDKQLQACYTTKVYRGILLENWDTVDSKTKLTAYQLVRESFLQDMKPTMDMLMSAIKKAVSEKKGLEAIYKQIANSMITYKRNLYKDNIPDAVSKDKTGFSDWTLFSDTFSLPLYHWQKVAYEGSPDVKGGTPAQRYLNFLVNNTWYSIPVPRDTETYEDDIKERAAFQCHIQAAAIEALNEYSYSVYELKSAPDKLTAISDSTKLGDKENLNLQYYVNPLTGVLKVNYISDDTGKVETFSSVYDYVTYYYTTENGKLAFSDVVSDDDRPITYGDFSGTFYKGYNFKTDNGALAMSSTIPWLMQQYYTATSTKVDTKIIPDFFGLETEEKVVETKRQNVEFRLRINPTYLEWLVGHIYSGWEKGGLYDITSSSSVGDLAFVAPFKRLDSSASSGNIFVNTVVPVTYINKWYATSKSGIYSYLAGSSDKRIGSLYTGLGSVGVLGKNTTLDKSSGWRYNLQLQTTMNVLNAQDSYSVLFKDNRTGDKNSVSSVAYSLNLDSIYYTRENLKQGDSRGRTQRALFYNFASGAYCIATLDKNLGLSNTNVAYYLYSGGKKDYWGFRDEFYSDVVPVAVEDTMYYYNDIELDSVGNLQLMQINYVCSADELPKLKFGSKADNVLVHYPTVRTVAVATEYLEAIMYDKDAKSDNVSFSWSGTPVATGRTLTFNFEHLDSMDMFSGNQAVVYNKIAATEAVGSQYSQTKITLSNATAQDIIYQAQATHQGILLMVGAGSYNNSGLLNWLQTDYANEYMSKYVTKTGITASEMYNKLTSKGISLDIGDKSDLLSRYMEIEQELSSQTQYGVVHTIFSAVAFVGVLVLVYSVLLVIAYFLDIFNAFSDISILSLITFGGCRAVTNIKDIERLGLPVDKKHKYVSLRGIIIRWCTCTLLGIALLSATQIYAWITLLYRYLSGFFGI